MGLVTRNRFDGDQRNCCRLYLKIKKGKGSNYYGLSTSLAAGIGPFIGDIIVKSSNFHVIILF